MSLEQWLLTFFAPWTPKIQKISLDPYIIKVSYWSLTGGPLNTCKKGLQGYKTLLLWSLQTPYTFSMVPFGVNGPRVKNGCTTIRRRTIRRRTIRRQTIRRQFNMKQPLFWMTVKTSSDKDFSTTFNSLICHLRHHLLDLELQKRSKIKLFLALTNGARLFFGTEEVLFYKLDFRYTPLRPPLINGHLSTMTSGL